MLDDTYIVFASDNGFFRGEHRIAGGKYLAYEPSSRVPLMIRGPGIPAGVQSDELVSAIDIPQTIEEIATGATDPDADGRSFLPYALNPALRSTRPLLLEADTGPGKGNAGFDPQTASVSAAKVAKVKVAGRKGVKNLDQEKMADEDGRQRQLRPRLPRDSHRPLPLRPLRQRPERALRPAARPGPAALQARRPALPLRAQVPLRPARRPRHLPQRRLPHRGRPRPGAAAEEEGEAEAKREAEDVALGYDWRPWGTGQIG